MLKRLGMTAAAVALVGLGAASSTPALGSNEGRDDGRERTIRFDETTVEEAFVDVGAKGPGLGDSFVFSAKLMRDGKQVGRDGGVCTIVSVKTSEAHCVATLWLAGGQITAQGLVKEAAKSFAVAVNGGSGAYQGVSGELHIRNLSATRSTLTLHLRD